MISAYDPRAVSEATMAAPIDEVLGAEMMRPEAREEVIRRLAALPAPASERRYLYGRWARMVGVEVTAEDARRVGAAVGTAR